MLHRARSLKVPIFQLALAGVLPFLVTEKLSLRKGQPCVLILSTLVLDSIYGGRGL